MQQPEDEEQQDEERCGKNGEDGRGEREQEGPVAPGVTMRLAQVAHDEAIVPAIGLPRDVEQVAEERDGADDDTEAEVDRHAQQRHVRDATNPRSENQDGGGDAGDDVAEAGNETDEAIEPEADGRAGNAEPVVEQVGVEVEVLIGKELFEASAERAGGPVRRQNLRVGLGGHDAAERRVRKQARYAAMLQSWLEWRL
jgi:hypothetical protein